MIKIFFEKLKVKFFWWKFGLKTKEFQKLVDLTKYMENHQPCSNFNLQNYLQDLRKCDK